MAATAVGSFASVFTRLGLVAQAAKGAIALTVAATLLLFVLPDSGIARFFLILVGLAATCHFGVNWCRVMLMGPQGLPARSLSWEDVHWRFMGYGLLLGLIMLLATLPLSVIGSVLAAALGLMRSPETLGPGVVLNFGLVFIGMLFVLARLGFILPAVAARESYSLGLAWQHTAGQSLRLTTAMLVVLLPVTLAQLAASEVLMQAIFGQSMTDMLPTMPRPGEELPSDLSTDADGGPSAPPSKVGIIAFNLLSAVVNFLSFAVLFSLLSLAFRALTGWVPASSSNLPAASPGTNEDDGNPER